MFRCIEGYHGLQWACVGRLSRGMVFVVSGTTRATAVGGTIAEHVLGSVVYTRKIHLIP